MEIALNYVLIALACAEALCCVLTFRRQLCSLEILVETVGMCEGCGIARASCLPGKYLHELGYCCCIWSKQYRCVVVVVAYSRTCESQERW